MLDWDHDISFFDKLEFFKAHEFSSIFSLIIYLRLFKHVLAEELET